MGPTDRRSPVLAVITDAGLPAPALLAAQLRKGRGGEVEVVHGPWESVAATDPEWVVVPQTLALRMGAATGRTVVPYDPAGGPAAWRHLFELP